MDIKVLRYNTGESYTDGLIHVNDKFECYSIEDGFNPVKIKGETRIPDGNYKIGFRKEGGFNNRYKSIFGGAFHKGMLEIKDVPNYKYILIHMGNSSKDTEGCLLVGSSPNSNKEDWLSDSKTAYVKLYQKVRDALLRDEDVNISFITIG